MIGSELAGGDCIDDVAVLRSGAAPELWDQVRAPSTVGTWLRTFAWFAVRQLVLDDDAGVLGALSDPAPVTWREDGPHGWGSAP